MRLNLEDPIVSPHWLADLFCLLGVFIGGFGFVALVVVIMSYSYPKVVLEIGRIFQYIPIAISVAIVIFGLTLYLLGKIRGELSLLKTGIPKYFDDLDNRLNSIERLLISVNKRIIETGQATSTKVVQVPSNSAPILKNDPIEKKPMKCVSCGATLTGDEKFCEGCGVAV